MKQHFRFSRLGLPLVTGMLLLLAWTSVLAGPGTAEVVSIPAQVEEKVATAGKARVLILLQPAKTGDRGGEAAAIRRAQDALLERFAPGTFDVKYRYQALPALSGQITAEGLHTLARSEGVAALQLDRPGSGHLGQSVPALEADRIRTDYGLTGAGVTVAFLDSGVDSDHPDIVDDLVAQHCFTDGNCPPEGSNEGTSAEDEQGHGSNVASIVTARGIVAGPGFAPDAEIVAVRVLDRYNRGWVSDWVAGLDWLVAQQPVLDVEILNMSLGTWALYAGNCDAQEPVLAYALRQVQALGITMFASSGNQGAAEALAAPACNSGVIAVGATYDGDLGREPDSAYGDYYDWFGANWPECYDSFTSLETITCFTNSSDMLDLLAPGARITGAGLNGERWTFIGTSQAAPTAAGIAALMLEADGQLTPAEIEGMLKDSGRPVTDPRSGRRVPATNALAALQPLLPVAPRALAISGPERASTGVPTSFMASVTPLSSTLPLYYRWQATGLAEIVESGSLSSTVTFTWAEPGSYTVAVSAANERGVVASTHQITVEDVGVTDVTLNGDSVAATGTPYRLQARAEPETASWPISYRWDTDGQPTQVHSTGLTDEATFTWNQPGSYTVTVAATNVLNTASRSRVVDVAVVGPQSVSLSGPVRGVTGRAYTFTAAPTPLPLSQPLSYTWQVSDYPATSMTGGTQVTAAFTWHSTGEKEIGVAVANAGGRVQGFVRVEIVEALYQYLPVIGK